ncbi:GumC family protein [Prevotella nigrescens]|uniref:GumC family protein n=1 Tax=Prevotella nigrescens TaxID=28133 RepID=UPI0002182E27|nr:polysaccharide biosynthesis tyrosine autokinase [Prevotella nigrescens]EGQ17314.1 EPS membrane protein [Prevotella nigrescens ATCC 33563]UAK29040.1 polysaccharide biosynthesis tyrosine autokinase [Prevotella nigrescens]WMS21831.1 polysaccharide biosynthesis tyrosine autokinase [Prevotella nigrescens]SUB91993.1 Tyrosine-protein kinase YwqD [Prevotella nigrescens]
MIEENKNVEKEYGQDENKNSFINFQLIYRTVILNWYWFILSVIICVGLAAIYLRYTTPTYQTVAKLLIKDQEDNKKSGIKYSSNLGTISNSEGIDNEIEILGSRSVAQDAVRDLKLYVNYTTKGRLKTTTLYRNQPLNVDVDSKHLENLNRPIELSIKRDSNTFILDGTYYVPTNERDAEGPFTLNTKFYSLPHSIVTRAGVITISSNQGRLLRKGEELNITLQSPKNACGQYVNDIQISKSSQGTSIAYLKMTDEIPNRSIDYLKQLVVAYNRQANEDKNTIALRTERFISSRLGKIGQELSATEGKLQNYKQQNGVVEQQVNAASSFSNQTASEQKLTEMETQIQLFNSIASEVKNSSRDFSQVIPSDVGLSDATASSLINKYNELVLERNRLLRSASASSPVVEPLTDQIRTLNKNIRRAIETARNNLEIQRDAVVDQFKKYNTEVAEAPVQERMIQSIEREHEVMSSLYSMLLQKREENSMSLAATVDKGKLIDDPQFAGIVSPNTEMIYLIALLVGLLLPSLVLFLIQFFRYKIEGHNDVVQLTKLPIIADVPVANEAAKGKADIVVHENQNNQMEEVFRAMRTNIQFILEENQKVILFTSSTSGEGKTFTAANLAVSFALLGKKVIFVGLDIRRPRLAEQFKINDHKHGITNLLIKNEPTLEKLKEQIVPSGVNQYLDLLMAGPIPPNPTELIARHSLNMVFDLLRQEYDYIIVDTAPVGLVTDTLQIGRIVDTTVYVCRADYTLKSSFDMINELSEEKKLPKMNIVLNGVDMSKKKYGYYYGYGRYGKYGRYGAGKYGKHGAYGNYGSFGNYRNSKYGNKNDNSIKR